MYSRFRGACLVFGTSEKFAPFALTVRHIPMSGFGVVGLSTARRGTARSGSAAVTAETGAQMAALPHSWKIAAVQQTTPFRTLGQEHPVPCSACRQDHETIFNRIVCFEVFSETNMISFKSAMLLAAFGFSVTGCTAMVTQASFYPSASLAAPSMGNHSRYVLGHADQLGRLAACWPD